jgi:hypothetical protein
MADAPEQQPMPWWRRVVPLVLAVALLAFVVHRVDLHALLEQLGRVSYPLYVGFAFVFVVSLLAVDSFAALFAYRAIAPVRFVEVFVVRGASYLPSILNHHIGQAFVTYSLARMHRVTIWRFAGGTLLVYATWTALLLILLSAAIVLLGKPLWWLGVIAALAIVYLILLVGRPAVLVRQRMLAPLFEAGVHGHLVALATRTPHLIVLFAGTWVPFFFFDVHIPFAHALGTVPVLLVVVTLPLTPQGIGTRDVLSSLFYEPFASGLSRPERLAQIAASTATWAVTVTLINALVGFVMMHFVLPALQRRRELGSPP